MKEKWNINAEFKKINSISLEHIQKKDKTIHSFILFYITAKTEDDVALTNVGNNRGEIIESDYQLIANDFKKRASIKTINSAAN
jgi:hypothetical protein